MLTPVSGAEVRVRLQCPPQSVRLPCSDKTAKERSSRKGCYCCSFYDGPCEGEGKEEGRRGQRSSGTYPTYEHSFVLLTSV